MKTLYFFNNQWKKVADKGGYSNMYCSKLHYGEMPEDKVMTFQDFQFAIDTFANKSTRPQVHYTLFRKKPYLFFHIDCGLDCCSMDKRTFKPFIIRNHFWKAVEPFTIKQLMNELPANEFIEYCKDHELSVIMGN